MEERTVITIPARRKPGNRKKEEQTHKLRVAAYCRVSTDSEEQETSYEAQVEHFESLLSKNPSWENAGIYADDGISGTNVKKRAEFQRMIADCDAGKIDLIITKSISRFARNTLDCLKYIRQLKEKNVAVFFEKENINTIDSKGELLVTIMASIAQQESLSISQNVKIGIDYRNQQGKLQVCTNRFMGYDKDEDGKLIINEEEAKVVKRIYREYLDGASYYQIAHGLEADGIKTGAGKKKWLSSTLQKMLQNEKYIGDALLQKTITKDFLEKKRIPNDGTLPQYYVENNHEPIIPKDMYMRVQEEMVRRARLETGTGKRRVYSGKYALSSMVYCAHCGDLYQRTHYVSRDKRKKVVWRCVSRLHLKDMDFVCPSRTVPEEDLHAAVVMAINRAFAQREIYLPELTEAILETVDDGNSAEIKEVDKQIAEVQKQLVGKAKAKDKQAIDILGDQIDDLREKKRCLMAEVAVKEGERQKMQELEGYLKDLKNEVTEYDERTTRRLIKQVTIDDEQITVLFKGGIEITVNA